MALVKAENLTQPLKGLDALPALRQVGLIVGLAAAIALAVAVVLWSQEPSYSMLYGGLSTKDQAQVVDALEKASIPHKLERGADAVMVPAGKVHEARLALAQRGLPKSDVTGLEFLDKDQGMGTSRMIERARYHRALSGELVRSIKTLDSVESARVHLAIPKQSAFVSKRGQPSASVLVNLYSGRTLDDNQVAGIVHLVASSISSLEPADVTVVDQAGHLLTRDDSDPMHMGARSLDYTQRLEERYVKRIDDILAPMVGANGVQAQVAAAVDFTSRERTSEDYDSDPKALRSEQTDERRNVGPASVGIPGALTNQPPAGGTLSEPEAQSEDASRTEPTSTTRSATRNYEVDRTVSHTRAGPGRLERLSVAVVVDDREQRNADGELERVARSPQEMEYFTTLVRNAVGFDAERGDTVSVINTSFKPQPLPEPVVEPPFWEQPLMWSLARQLLGGLGVLILMLGVLRPVLRSLADKSSGAREAVPLEAPDQLAVGEDRVSLSSQPVAGAINDQPLSHARSLAKENPQQVAQVMKTWLAAEEGQR